MPGMEMVCMDRKTQAQQIRESAFFAARDALGYNHSSHNQPTLEDRFEMAERIEEWLWKANEDRALTALLAAATNAAEVIENLIHRHGKDERASAAIREIHEAVELLNSPSPMKKRRVR